jgi:hypothetical protein
MSILWKMTVFIEKSPVTSSNRYKTIKTASILIKFGTNVYWTNAFVPTYPGLNLLLPWQRGDISNCKNPLFCVEFFHLQLISKCCNFSMDLDRVKCFSAFVTRYLIIDLGLILASQNSNIFLANPPNRRVHIPFLAVPWCICWLGVRRKSGHFFKQHFSNKNKCLEP